MANSPKLDANPKSSAVSLSEEKTPDQGTDESIKPKGPIKRVLIIGASSYLGSALALGLRNEFDVIGTYFKHPVRIEGVPCVELDCLNPNSIFETVKLFQPEALFFCPGQQDIDAIQANSELGDNLHAKAPALFFKLPVASFHFIYFSSDQGFGLNQSEGQLPPYSESILPHSMNSYGQTKLQGESLIRSQSRFAHILRLGEVFGEPFGSGDVGQIRKSWIESYRRRLERGETVFVSKDEIRRPLYVGDFVRAVRTFLLNIQTEVSIYHLSGADSISRFDFIQLMAEKFGLDVTKVRSGPDPFHRAPRPVDCSISSEKFEKAFNFQFQTAQNSLEEFAQRMRTGFTNNWL